VVSRGGGDGRANAHVIDAGVSVYLSVSGERTSVRRCVVSVDDATNASVGSARHGVLCAASVAATDARLGRDGRV
jgi:hypothetical protein